jgi:soluble lytic murein transglycosylase-like protein
MTAPGMAKDLSGSPFAPAARAAVAKQTKSAEAGQTKASKKKSEKVGANRPGRKKHAIRSAKAASKAKAKRRMSLPKLPGIDPVRTASIATAGDNESGRYTAIVARYASEYGIPASLAHAVIQVESNYRPGMTGSAGEVGLMQIKPSTARMLGYGGSVKGLYDPKTNIKYGMKYLAMAQDLGDGTTCGTILKYNAGHAARRMNPVSAAYCRKVKVQLASAGSPA